MMIEKNCEECQKPFNVEKGIFSWLIRLCEVCHEEALKKSVLQAAQEEQQRRWKQFCKICPPLYRSIEKEKLPMPGKLDEVMAWPFNPLGLLIHGKTGLGKTRCAWALLARECLAGKSAQVLDSMAGLEYAANFSISPAAVYEWVELHIESKILLLDDVFKSKLTDSFESVIFTIFDQRAQYLRPTIITTNDSGSDLSARMSADRGEPLLRRLREHCDVIQF